MLLADRKQDRSAQEHQCTLQSAEDLLSTCDVHLHLHCYSDYACIAFLFHFWAVLPPV